MEPTPEQRQRYEDVAHRIERLQDQLEDAYDERHELLVELKRDGATYSDLAELTGLTRAACHQVVTREAQRRFG